MWKLNSCFERLNRAAHHSAQREMDFNSTGKKEFCLICVLNEGIWNESVCKLCESLREGTSLISVIGTATFSFCAYKHRYVTMNDFMNTKDTHHIGFISFNVKCLNVYTHAHFPTVV